MTVSSRNDDMLASLRELQDEREIERGLGLFARALDSKAYEELRNLFAEDMTYNYGDGLEQTGLETMLAMIRKNLSMCGRTQHLLGSIQIDVKDDRAISRAYVQARHCDPGIVGGRIFDTNGEYTDRWERRPEGWRIVRRDAEWFSLSGEPEIIGLKLGTSE